MKHYIVANKKQELEVLGKLEEAGFMWVNGHKLPTEVHISEFPYVVIADNNKNNAIMWSTREVDFERNVVYDGRKEEKMTKKYKVTQEFIVALIKWQDSKGLDATSGYGLSLVSSDLAELPRVVLHWWEADKNPMERNRRLIAIISWLNGDGSVFEVEEPNKFVIRSEKPNWDGDYWYVRFTEGMEDTTTYLSKASKFDTREEAQEWANSHQVVIEVGSEG